MASTRVTECFPVLLDATKAPIAYGNLALPRMNKEMNDGDVIIKQKALYSLCDYLHDPEHIAAAIKLGTVEVLKVLMIHKDQTVRLKSTESLYILASHAVGRDALVDKKVISLMPSLFEDSVTGVRYNIHSALARAAQSSHVALEIVNQKIVPMLVQKLISETDDIVEVIEETLHFCFKVDVSSALENGAMQALLEMLHHTKAKIRGLGARAIMGLAVPTEGKEEALRYKCVEPLVALLKEEDEMVKEHSAAAIMMIAIITPGKYAILECEAIPLLLNMLGAERSECRLYALKALTCLSEAPEGRKILLHHVEEISRLLEDISPAVAEAAGICIRVIQWKP